MKTKVIRLKTVRKESNSRARARVRKAISEVYSNAAVTPPIAFDAVDIYVSSKSKSALGRK